MQILKVKLLSPAARLPARATSGSTGFDVYACIDGDGELEIGPDVSLVPTGIAVEIPEGYDLQVRPRSGLSRSGVMVILGTIDADYRGEILVSMHTFGSKTSYVVHDGDRIAQLVLSRLAEAEIEVVGALSESERDRGGHGSTGR